MSNSNFGSGPGSGSMGGGTGSNVSTGTGNTGGFGNTGSTGSSGSDFSTAASGGFGAQSGTDTGICPHCGQSTKAGGLEQFLGRLGITDEMLSNLKGSFQNVNIDEYLDTARDYLKGGSTKAGAYAKENPGKVAAGVAALAVGAGLIYAAVNRDKS
jgi:hypothetical protein